MERNKASRISLNTNEPLCFSCTRPVLLTQTLSHPWAFVRAVHSSWNALALLLCLLEYLISRQGSDSASSRKPSFILPLSLRSSHSLLCALRAFHLPLSLATCHSFLPGNNNNSVFVHVQAIYMHFLCPRFTEGQTEEQRS